MITREQIAQLLKSISEAHYQIHSYGWGDVPDLLAREDVIYPFLMVTPSSSNYEEGYATHTYTISIADRVLKDKVNEVNVDSDTHQILLDILSQIDNLMYDDVDVVKGGTITPFFDNFRHEVTGHFAEVGIRVKFAYDSCAVPSDIVPLPLPPPFECADASYRVQYVNGTLIEQGTIVSGGSKTINVPNPSTCDPASYEVRDANGSVLYSGTIASGGSQNIVVTNSTVVVRKSDNTIISSVSVLAQGSANYQVADSVITLTDTSAATISTTNVKATDPATIVAPNGTLNVNKSDGALISGQVVKSGETKGYNVADSVAVIKDSANTTLKSENIKATESENIVINDSSVENSDATYSVNILAEGSLVLPDSQIKVNGLDAGNVVSVKPIDVNITDGVDQLPPDSILLVGNTLTIEVPSGGGSYDLDLVDRFGNAFPTKQVSANATWDLRTLTPFDWADLFLSRETSWGGSTIENAFIDAIDSLFTSGLNLKILSWHPHIGGTASHCKWNALYPFDNRKSFVEIYTGATFNAQGVRMTTNQFTYSQVKPLDTESATSNVFGAFLTNEFDSNAQTTFSSIFNTALSNGFARAFRINIRPSDGSVTWNVNNNNNSTYTPPSQPTTYINKHYSASRINNTDQRLYIDGALVQTITASVITATSAIPNNDPFLVGYNGLSANPFNNRIGSIYIGYGLNGTEMGDLHTILNTFEGIVR